MMSAEPPDPRGELARIDHELAALPAGQLVERRKGGVAWIFRLYKGFGKDRFEAIGPVGGPEHLVAREAAERRRELGRRRRELARNQDRPGRGDPED
jgi:hypothetical protein